MRRDVVYYAHCKAQLARSPLFTGLSDALMDDMLGMFRRDNWRRGVQLDTSIFQRRLYLLVDGRVEVTRINPQTGRSITLFLLGPGDGIDMITLLNDHPHDVVPVALDDVSLISVPLADARAWLEKHPEFNRNFLPYLGEQMRKLEDLATDLALHDTMTRLARLILRHVRPEHKSSRHNGRTLHLINDLHDESLARMVGSVRQVVNRHLQHWRKHGILHKHHFQTVVTELESLQEYAADTSPHTNQKSKTAENR